MRILLSSGFILLSMAGTAAAGGAVQLDSPPSSHLEVEFAQVQMPQSGDGQMQMPPQGGMMMPGVGQGQSGPGGPMAANPEMMQRMHEMMMRRMREHDEDEHHEEAELRRSQHRGAFVRFKRGDVEVDIRCPIDESMRDCVADASPLLDKLGSLSGQPSPSH